MTKITLKGAEVDLEDLFEEIETKHLLAEIDQRHDEEIVIEWFGDVAAEYCDRDHGDDEHDEPSPLGHLTDWDLDELRKALREDDGRRCIDVLRRAA